MAEIDPEDHTLAGGPFLGISPAPAASDVPCQVLAGRYELLALLGTGGMGAVYRARDRELGELVALKMLRRELASVPDMLARFRLEVKLARKVTSPHVARTFDIGEHQGERFLTMELVEGESLATVIAREAPLPPARAVALGREVASGLAAAHAVGVVHRDLKPENVLLTRDGDVKVTDFGIATVHADAGARVTQGVVGTPAYMAPEQVTAERTLDARADVYALGVMLYEMLTGALPWAGDTILAMAAARLLDEPPDPRRLRPDLPAPLAELVLACMARDRAGRPADGAAVRDALAALAPLVASETASRREPDARPVLHGVRPTPAQRTVAVLPLANEGPADDAYVAAGLTDELIDALSLSHAMRVQSRAAVARAHGLGRDAREIGRDLGVEVVVTGSMRRAGERVRLTVRMLSVADGFQLAARRFERSFGEVLALADEASLAIQAALALEPAEETARPGGAGLADPETLELYLRARHAGRVLGVDRMAPAYALFEQALARSPDDPLVLAGYATALVRGLGFRVPEPEVFRAAERMAERAAALAPQLCEAHLALAVLRTQECRFDDGARHTRRALEIAPSNPEARLLMGRQLLDAGHPAEARAHLRVARELGRGLSMLSFDLVRLSALLGEWDRARGLLFELLASDEPTWPLWVTALRLFGIWRRDEALDEVRARLAASPLAGDPDLRRYDALLDANDPEPVVALFRRVPGAPTNTPFNQAFGAQMAAEAYARAGRHDAAGAELASAVARGLSDVMWLENCPVIAPLRATPGYAALHATVAERAASIARVLR